MIICELIIMYFIVFASYEGKLEITIKVREMLRCYVCCYFYSNMALFGQRFTFIVKII